MKRDFIEMGTEKENYANMIHRIQGKHINRIKKKEEVNWLTYCITMMLQLLQ